MSKTTVTILWGLVLLTWAGASWRNPDGGKTRLSIGTDTTCKSIKVTEIHEYSPNNRYFNAGLTESFILYQGGFGVYQAGGPDSYTWDSLKHCHGKYVFHYGNTVAQESNLHGDVLAEISPHDFTLLNTMGIFGPGKYNLLYDFNHNEKGNLVPGRDTGRWQMTQGRTPLQVMVLGNKEAEFALNASFPLQKCRIDEIRIDRIDNSELFEISAIDSGFFRIGVRQQVVIKHSPKNAIILIAPPGQVPIQTIQYLTKL